MLLGHMTQMLLAWKPWSWHASGMKTALLACSWHENHASHLGNTVIRLKSIHLHVQSNFSSSDQLTCMSRAVFPARIGSILHARGTKTMLLGHVAQLLLV